MGVLEPVKTILALVALLLVTHCSAFAAPAGLPGPVRIALVTDTHTNLATTGDEALYKTRLDQTIAAVNSANVALVLISGDLTQGGKQGEMDAFEAQIKAFTPPVRVVPGNHDVGGKLIPGKTGGVTGERVSAYESVFGPSFWTEHLSGLRIIGLNSSIFGSGLPVEDRQWAFIEAELAVPSTEPTIVVMHYPPFLTAPDEPGGGYWDIEPAPRQRLLALLQKGHVSAVLTGHLHRPLRNDWNGIPLITSLPVSFGLPKDVQPEGWTLITVAPNGTVTAETETIKG